MKSKKAAWIPALVFGLSALGLWGLTLYHSGTPALGDVLSLTDFYTALLKSLLARLGSALAGCLVGFGVGLALSRAPSPFAAALGALVLLPLFVPPPLLLNAGFLEGLSFPFRAMLFSALKTASLSAFACCLFRLRRKAASGALLTALVLFCALLSPDPETALLNPPVGEMTLDAWALARVRDPLASAASFLRMTVEILCALTAAALLHSLTLSGRPEPVQAGKGIKPFFPVAVFGAAVLVSCLVLLPFLLQGAFGMEEGVRTPLVQSLLAAGLALPVSFAAAALVLFLTGRSGRGAFAILAAGLITLSGFTPAKPLLFLGGPLPALLPAALEASFSQEVLVLLLLTALFSFRQRSMLLWSCAGLSLLAAGRALVSITALRVYGFPSLASLLTGAESAGTDGMVLLLCLLCYVLSALCFSRPLSCEIREAKKPVRVGQTQGLKPDALTAPRVSKASVDPDRPLFSPREEPALPDSPRVPAREAYTRQYAQNASWMPPKAPSPALPVEPVEEAPPEEAAPQDAPLPEPRSGPAPEKETLPSDGPSPAQVVSLINALTKMRSMGIVSDMEYREKRDRLMKLL